MSLERENIEPLFNFFKNIYNNKWHLLVFIFLFSIFCSIIFLSFFKSMGPAGHSIPNSDYFDYYKPIADSIVQGKGIVREGKVLTFIAPIFPIILSVAYLFSGLTGINSINLIITFNVIFSAFTACFLFLIAEKLFNKKIALISSFLWLTYPFNLWFLKNPNTEVPFIFFLYFGLFLYVLSLKKKNVKLGFLAGIVLGLSSLARLTSLFLPIFLCFLVFFLLKDNYKKRVLFALILLLGFIIAILPWEIYTLSQGRDFVSICFGMGTGSIPYSIVALSLSGDKNWSDGVSQLIERAENEFLKDRNKQFKFLSQELITRPSPFFKVMGLKFIRSWYATSQQWWEGKILLIQMLYLSTGLLGVIYVFKKDKYKIKNAIILLAVIFYFWIVTFLIISILRYMIPIMPLVMIFSAIGLNWIYIRILNQPFGESRTSCGSEESRIKNQE